MPVRKVCLSGIAVIVAVVLAYDAHLLWEADAARQTAARRGFTCRWLTDSTGHKSRYVVFMPHVPPPENGYPVILFLNGFGENGDDGTRQLSRNLGACIWEMKGRFPFVVVAPQCHAGGAWTEDGPDRRRALETLEEVIETHGCDRDRVIVTGPSSGGAGVLAVAASQPELFAAAVPLCAGSGGDFTIEELAQNFASRRLPVWSFYNDGDAPGLVAFNRQLQLALLRQGLSPHWTEYHRDGHNAWEATYRNPALYDWMLRQNRTLNRRQKMFELLARETPLSNSVQVNRGTGDVDETGVVHVASADSGDPVVLTLERPVVDFEAHLECWLDGTHPVVIELVPTDTNAESIRIVVVLPEQGVGGVFSGSSGECLAGFDPIAQRALQAGRWNDLRVRSLRGEVQVYGNGWKLLERIAVGASSRRLRLETGVAGAAFRFVRMADAESEGGR